MVLQDFKVAGGWIQMNWSMSTKASWAHLIKGTRKMKGYYDNMVVMTGSRGGGGVKVDINNDIAEAQMLVIQGQSNILNGPLMITFTNGSETVAVAFPSTLDTGMDYESLSKNFGSYMDSYELMMYIK